jgi:hypothetical protein
MRTGRRGANFIRRFGRPRGDSGVPCVRLWQLVLTGWLEDVDDGEIAVIAELAEVLAARHEHAEPICG